MCDREKFDIFGITETHLSSDINNNEININGYSILRNDRETNNWGGTLIYYAENLAASEYLLKLIVNQPGLK